MSSFRRRRSSSRKGRLAIGAAPVLAFLALLVLLFLVGPIVNRWINTAEDDWVAHHRHRPNWEGP
jgi:hypothetical protein